MSLFDYPRINFEGTLQLSPGTANNDDYAANYIHLLRAFGIAALSAIMVRPLRSKIGLTRPVSIQDMFRRVSKVTMERPVRFLDIRSGFDYPHQSAKI